MKKLLTFIAIIGFCLSGTLVSVATPIDKSKPAYVWFDQCSNENDLDCIESLGIVDAAGNFTAGKPTGYSRPDILKGSRETRTAGFIDYVGIHPNQTWQIPGLLNEFGNNYVITEFSLVTGIGSWYDPVTDKIYPGSGINSMRFAVLAVPKIEGFAGELWGVPLKNFDHKCVTQDYKSEMVCQRTANFSSEQNLQATLRFSWYRASQVQSNLRENSYVVEELGGGATRVTVSGKPIERPYFVDSLSLEKDIYKREKADSLSNQWEVVTQDQFDNFTPPKCRNSGVPIATGNMYSQTPPIWDSSTGDLTVKVWAPHLDPSGAEFKGYYEGNFPTEYASCLWGVDASKIASELVVSVTDSGGQGKEVVTTSLVTTSTGVRIIATGFHYSTEKIKFHRRATGAVPAAETPQSNVKTNSSETPTTTSSPKPTFEKPIVKKTGITCIKGKTIKKVTAFNPKCPKGFKKI